VLLPNHHTSTATIATQKRKREKAKGKEKKWQIHVPYALSHHKSGQYHNVTTPYARYAHYGYGHCTRRRIAWFVKYVESPLLF